MAMTTEEYARELLAEFKTAQAVCPYRAAFVAALDARGTDGRTAQFKHYDKIIKWMCANWTDNLDPFQR